MILKKIASQTALTGLGMAFFQLTNFLLAIFIARSLGVDELGHYQYFIVTTTFLSYLAKLGCDEMLAYKIPALGGITTNEARQLASETLCKTLLASILIAALYELISTNTNNGLLNNLSMLFYLPSFVGTLVIAGILRAESNVGARSLITYYFPNLITGAGIFLIADYVTNINASIAARTLTYFLIFISALLIFTKSWNLKLPKNISYRNLKGQEWGWLLLSISTFTLESGAVLIWFSEHNFSAQNTGEITIVLRLAGLILLIPTAITMVASPYIEKNTKKTQLIKNIFFVNLVFCCIFSVLIFGFKEFLLGFFGENIKALSAQLAQAIIGIMLIGITGPLNMALIYANKKNILTFINLLAIAALIITLLVLGEDEPEHIFLALASTCLLVFICKIIVFIRLFLNKVVVV